MKDNNGEYTTELRDMEGHGEGGCLGGTPSRAKDVQWYPEVSHGIEKSISVGSI